MRKYVPLYLINYLTKNSLFSFPLNDFFLYFYSFIQNEAVAQSISFKSFLLTSRLYSFFMMSSVESCLFFYLNFSIFFLHTFLLLFSLLASSTIRLLIIFLVLHSFSPSSKKNTKKSWWKKVYLMIMYTSKHIHISNFRLFWNWQCCKNKQFV